MMTSKLETITPELASSYLERNRENNRNMNMNVVARYANDMKNGRWDGQNGESIKFNIDGELVDGQHRLAACKLAGVPFNTMVVYGVSKDAIKTIDDVFGRSAGAVFKVYNIPNANSVAAIVKGHMGLKNKRNVIAGTGQGVQYGGFSNTLVVECYEQKPELYNHAFLLAQRCYSSCRVFTISNIGSIAAYLQDDGGYSEDYIADFFEQLTDCKPFEWNVLRECRKKFLEDKISTVHMEGSVKQALIIKAWNYFVCKKDVGIGKFCYNNKYDKDRWFLMNK